MARKPPTLAAIPSASRRREINYPLVEGTRPPVYKAMKYWGKKPHNIWAEYIDCYCPLGGIVVDPFAGSAVAAFEAVKLGRKAIAFDLNPLSSFIIEITASGSKFDKETFLKAAKDICAAVEETHVYKQNYVRERKGETGTVVNYRWEDGEVAGVALRVGKVRRLIAADANDVKLGKRSEKMTVPLWHPTCRFPAHPSISHKFLADVGGNTMDRLWTRRNLYLLAAVFQKILATSDEHLKMQLLSAFVQSLHLCSKMVIPRHAAANRDFSGSWGRADYLVRRRQMEQNPVDVFWR